METNMAAEICHFRSLEKLSGNDYTGGHSLDDDDEAGKAR